MCAINGFNFKDEELIKEMNQATSHRGPDGTGVFCDEGISLGHNRLSIIDLSAGASQPMKSADGKLTVVFNGEIYNFKELKNELGSYPFRTKSDTEVILAAYKKWGKDCVKKFNGIFSFAVWDEEKEKLFLARDHMGIKPLYYFWDGGKFIFSSEIKAIVRHQIKKEILPEAFSFYFHLRYIPTPFTIYKNIFKLPAGSRLELSGDDLNIEKYWQPTIGPYLEDKKQIKKEILELLDSSVKMQLISDRPVGVFLSGGIDSSAVLSFAAKHSPHIKTFSVGFDVEDQKEKFNADFNLARKTAGFFGAEHHELVISGKDVLENLEKVAYHMDEPVCNATQAVTFLLSQYAVSEVAVVLGGDGGDEIFGGYERYKISRIISKFQKLPALAMNVLDSFSEKLSLPPGAERYLNFMSENGSDLAKVIKPGFLDGKLADDFFSKNYFYKKEDDFENNFMLADLQTWLVDESLMRTDKMSMAAGLEERVPFLDSRLVELGFRIPSKFKLSFMDTKIILKDALRPQLPPYLFNQPKRGWFSPMAKWLRTDLKDFSHSVLSPGYCPETGQFFDFNSIKKILDDHIEKRKYNLNLIWSLISFQLWYRKFM